MVNDLKDLMRQNVAAPPPDHLDLDALVGAGRRRIHRRRASVGGFVSVMVAGAVAAAAIGWPGSSGKAQPAERPTPDAPTIRLADAEQAVPGRDYRVVTSYTNENLDRDNGQYFDGVTDDGLVLFRDGPRMDQLYPRFALLDPSSGEKDWLPDLKIGQTQALPVDLGADRLVLLTVTGAFEGRLVAHVFDRTTRQWSTVKWPGLPNVDHYGAVMGPDGRLYIRVPASRGQVPEGGWPTGPDGEAEDADADGDTYDLWSLSTTDSSDVRDEQMTVGDFAFTGSSLVWTDSTNGDAGMIHVRDLATGEEHSFDPHAGERCNLLSFGATEDRIVLGQYCGTYAEGGRDDRVQILTTDGDQVVTIQDAGIDGGVAGYGASNEVVTVTSYDRDRGGTYVYDLGTDSFVRLTDGVSKFGVGGGPVPEGYFMWHTPVNKRHGAKLWLGETLS